MNDIWSTVNLIAPISEADVEIQLVLPLLAALGYETTDIKAKQPIEFHEGRAGRRPEADFVVYDGPKHDKDHSLIVVEAKAPNEKLELGRGQAESYALAKAIRAHILLITNGITLEIWQLQPTLENDKVLDINVSDLAAQQGRLEELISKEAAISYASTLPHRKLVTVLVDFSAYLNAERERYVDDAPCADRSLQFGPSRQIESPSLRTIFATGAVIVGSSGFGKSTLAKTLFKEAIEDCLNGPDARLPVEVFLPDLGAGKLIQFIADRLRPHHAPATFASVQNLLRDFGATVICDGFNRVSETLITAVDADLRLFQRDYPKVQLFVFASEARSPNISLDTLSLLPLSREQQSQVLNAVNPAAFQFLSISPTSLLNLAKHPLLLSIIAKTWRTQEPRDLRIVPIFQAWLQFIVGGPLEKLSIRLDKEAALSTIAKATFERPLTTQEISNLFALTKIEPLLLDSLNAAGAFRLQNDGSLELVHEALADFLRAKYITSGLEDEINLKISQMPMIIGSWLPILVLLMLRTPFARNIIWRRSIEKDLRLYVSLARHPFGEPFEITQEILVDDVRNLLDDIRLGVLAPIRAAFPALEEAILTREAGFGSNPIGIIGELNDCQWLSYGFRSEAALGTSVVIGTASDGRVRGVNLILSNMSMLSGRLIGLDLLNDLLKQVMVERALKGGKTWSHERLLSDLIMHFQEDPYNLSEFDLLKWREKLQPYQNAVLAATRYPLAGFTECRRMLDDIETLLAEGVSTFDCWWMRLGATRLMAADNPAWPALLDEHFRRAQILLAELVSNSFSGLQSSISFHNALPVRFSIKLTSGQDDQGVAFITWRPVTTWEEAGADVIYQVGYLWTQEEIDEHIRMVRSQLASFARSSADINIEVTVTILSILGRPDSSGRYRKATSALHQATVWLERDLKRVLKDRIHF